MSSTSQVSTRGRWAAAVVAVVVIGGGAVWFAPAGATPIPGNNGTIKVDGTAFDDHPNNEPHVGCVFQVDFYGYDEGDLDADVTFEGVAPTGGGELLTDTVFIGEDPAGGGTDLDASATYNLSAALAGVTPHPVQGYHVRLTVNAEGSQGADVKHKVFWVERCAPPPPPNPPGSTTTTTSSSTTTSTSSTTTTSTVPDSTTSTPSTTSVPDTSGSTTSTTSTTSIPATVDSTILGGGGGEEGGSSPPAVVEEGVTTRSPSEGLAFTGTGADLALAAAAAALVGGLALLRVRRRRP